MERTMTVDMRDIKGQIWRKLREVRYPGYTRDIVSFGLVQRVSADETGITVTLAIGHLAPETQQTLLGEVQQALQSLPVAVPMRVQVSRPAVRRSAHEAGAPSARPPGVRAILAVGSGKGGVGKSTVAVNLAVALAQQGLRVGLMDADVYGPNVPRMVGVKALPRPAGSKIPPTTAHGIAVVSLGLLVPPGTAVIWRGPMTDKLVRQFLADVAWGSLDALVVDLPPGTGDIAISLIRHGRPEGAILVVTPQEVALDDALKAADMFRSLQVPILGVVENMSSFVCDGCGKRHDLFGQNGGRRLAQTLDVPLLGQIPLEPLVREAGDQGLPAVLRPESAAGQVFRHIAEQVWQTLQKGQAAVLEKG